MSRRHILFISGVLMMFVATVCKAQQPPPYVALDEATVTIFPPDSGDYIVIRGTSGPELAPARLKQRYGTTKRYEIWGPKRQGRKRQLVCSDDIEVIAKYEEICVICNPKTKKLDRAKCAEG